MSITDSGPDPLAFNLERETLENPNYLTNMTEIISQMIIPIAMVLAFGYFIFASCRAMRYFVKHGDPTQIRKASLCHRFASFRSELKVGKTTWAAN